MGTVVESAVSDLVLQINGNVTTPSGTVGGVLGVVNSVATSTVGSSLHNVTVSVRKVSGSRVGGAVGQWCGGSMSLVKVTVDELKGPGYSCGGAVGRTASGAPGVDIELSQIQVSVNRIIGVNRVGGIIGETDSETSLDSSFVVIADKIESSGELGVGGVVGAAWSVNVSNCFAAINDVSGSENVFGGIVGASYSGVHEVVNCYVAGQNIFAWHGGDGGIASPYGNGETQIVSSSVNLLNYQYTGDCSYAETGVSARIMNLNREYDFPVNVKAILENNYAWEGIKHLRISGQNKSMRLWTIAYEDNSSGTDGGNVASEDIWDSEQFYMDLGWDFDSVWMINQNDNYRLPVLRWANTEITYNASYLAPLTVTFDYNFLDAEQGSEDIIVSKDTEWNITSLSAKVDAMRPGDELLGWNTKQDGSGDNYTNSSFKAVAPMTLYAVWKTGERTELGHVHTWDLGTISSYPSTTADGVITYTCTCCTAVSTDAISAIDEFILATPEPCDVIGHCLLINQSVPVTCTHDGHTEGKSCPVCGVVFQSPQIIVSPGHQKVIDPAISATATESGLTEGEHCSVCGEIFVAQQIIPATGVPQHKISGTVNSSDSHVGTVYLKLGNIIASEQCALTVPGSYVPGTYVFNNVTPGTYNLIIDIYGTPENTTITKMVVIDSDDVVIDEVMIDAASSNVSSKLNVAAEKDTPPVVVGNLSEEANEIASSAPGEIVIVTMNVSSKEETEEEVIIPSAAIKIVANGIQNNPEIEYLDVTITKQVGTAEPEIMSTTTNVIEMVIPFDFTGKDSVIVYHYHGGSAAALVESSSKAAGTYRLDRGQNLIYVYSNEFSVYAVGYTEVPQYTPSSSSKQSGYTVILQEGQVAPTQQPTVAPTVAPTTVPTANPTTTPQTPAPFAGLVLGLGAAAVLLRLRK